MWHSLIIPSINIFNNFGYKIDFFDIYNHRSGYLCHNAITYDLVLTNVEWMNVMDECNGPQLIPIMVIIIFSNLNDTILEIHYYNINVKCDLGNCNYSDVTKKVPIVAGTVKFEVFINNDAYKVMRDLKRFVKIENDKIKNMYVDLYLKPIDYLIG